MPPSAADRHYLASLFEPASVAVIGASRRAGSIGAVLIDNMRKSGYRGALYAVNPNYRSVLGTRCYDSIDALPEPVDLAVVATPAGTVPDVIDRCGRRGVRAAVVITAGFAETGPAGAALEQALVACARRHGIRVVGPNCLGLMRPELGFNATFARGGAAPGTLALVSQSGAICTALLDWAGQRGIGFSSVISLGGTCDVEFGEILDYLACDGRTEHILAYVEGIRNARRFLSALRAATRIKPVILMKVGRHPTGSRAARSHTGALVGADDVFDAAIRRTGAVRVGSVGELVAAAQALAAHLEPEGERLAIITNGGGPGVIAADRATDLSVPLADLSPQTLDVLRQVLPPTWSHGNPVDLIGDAGPDRYAGAVAACLTDPGVHGVLVVLTPQAMTDATAAARAVIRAARGSRKPVIACWMGGEQVAAGRGCLQKAGIPVFATPEPAVQMFAHVASYFRNRKRLLDSPPPLAAGPRPDVAGARALIAAALSDGRELLNEIESKALLAAFHIPVVPTTLALTADEAVIMARRAGFPVALKIHSPDITHKSDVGGVRLNAEDAADVLEAFAGIIAAVHRAQPQARIEGVSVQPMIRRPQGRELMVGIARDRIFGPAITFGTGGIAVEVHADRAVMLPPLSKRLAEELVAGTRAARLLCDFRGWKPVDPNRIAALLLRVSEIACELPEVRELDINPLLADSEGVIALDARVLIAAQPSLARRYDHLAIHPYPAELESSICLADGRSVRLRPIRPEDAAMERAFVAALSPESRYFRFMGSVRELTPAMLARFTQIDYDREMAFVATTQENGDDVEIGVARYVTSPDGETCEFAVTVADPWQRRGLGTGLMRALMRRAAACGLKRMRGEILAANRGMSVLAERLGFLVRRHPDASDVLRAEITLAGD